MKPSVSSVLVVVVVPVPKFTLPANQPTATLFPEASDARDNWTALGPANAVDCLSQRSVPPATVIALKFATRFLDPLAVKVYAAEVDTTVPDSVQFVKVYPILAEAVTVTDDPQFTTPPPETVPPPEDEGVMVLVCSVKVPTRVRLALAVKTYGLAVETTTLDSVQLLKA